MSPLKRTGHDISSEGSRILGQDDDEVAAVDSNEDEEGAALFACAEQNWAALLMRLMARDMRRHDSRSSGLTHQQ